jgi:hypothetical protein
VIWGVIWGAGGIFGVSYSNDIVFGIDLGGGGDFWGELL